MTPLRIASMYVAVVAGACAALMLIDGQLTDFGVAAAICAGSSVVAGLITYAGRRRRKTVAPGPAAVWEGRDQQAPTTYYQQCPLCGSARQRPSESVRSVDRQGPRHARRPSTQSRHDEPVAGRGGNSDGSTTRTGALMDGEPRHGVTWVRFAWSGRTR